MANVNQAGQVIVEERILGYLGDLEDHEVGDLLLKLIDHMGLEAWRTNATKHGHTEIQLRKKE